jgi:multidrug efflux pump subunit AcrA (membrane-fusion protein)
MNIDMNLAKQAILDKLEAQLKTAEAKLDTLKARAETAKANVEIKAVTGLLTKKQMIQQKLQELKKSGGDRWEQAKADLETRIADFERSVKEIGSKAKARFSSSCRRRKNGTKSPRLRLRQRPRCLRRRQHAPAKGCMLRRRQDECSGLPNQRLSQ